MDIEIVDKDGKVIYSETRETYRNGFVGVWLPKDIEATLTVNYDGYSNSMDITTYEDSYTCITSLQLFK